jgi:hypothetical protein
LDGYVAGVGLVFGRGCGRSRACFWTGMWQE